VNDTLGHKAGDDLLVSVGRRLEACAQARDLVARLGGDEFAVLLHGSDATARVESEARRILDVLRSPVASEGALIQTHISIGIAISNADQSASAVLRRADMAMYAAKRGGGGRYALFERAHEEFMASKRLIECRDALQEAS
jgi:diguanylate cyclase (GGDEF)-like protein